VSKSEEAKVKVTLTKKCTVRGERCVPDQIVEVLKHHAEWMARRGVIKEASTYTRNSDAKTEE